MRTAQLDFFRIVLEPGVNIKIFLDGGIKYNIYKLHTMGPLVPRIYSLGLTLFDTIYHFLPPPFYRTLTIFSVHTQKTPTQTHWGELMTQFMLKKRLT